MSRAAPVEIAILGGGLAGLSLATRLAQSGPTERRVVVLEPRTGYRLDRTWCHFSLARHPFEDCVTHRWGSWKLRHAGRDWRQRSRRYVYQELPSDRFYERALSVLARHPRVELRLGVRARGLQEAGDRVRVETDHGLVEARRVFDGRRGPGDPRPAGTGGLLQHFVGLRVRTERAAFDPSCVTLMDFDVSQEHGIHFLYVLPHAPDRALVEATFLSPAALPRDVYLDAIASYLSRRHGVDAYQVTAHEEGRIPMCASWPTPRQSRRITRIGTAGGLVRPSTGYAFLQIQRWSDAMAARLGEDLLAPPPLPRPRVDRALDAIFLSYLQRRPAEAPGLFARLFSRVEPDRLVRFLGEAASARDRLSVMAALPKAPFVREAWLAREAWLPA